MSAGRPADPAAPPRAPGRTTMTAPTLLPATDAERELVAALVARSHRDVAERFGLDAANGPKHPSRCTPAWIAAETARGDRYLVARVDGEAVGCVAVGFPDADTVHLNRLSVLPGWRRRGIGAALTRAVLEIAAGCGATRTTIGIIAAHDELAGWYRRLGFVDGATRRYRHLPFEVLEMAHATPADAAAPLFETPRLTCRRWRRGDLPALLAVYGDEDAMRWVGDGRAITAEDCLRWLRVTAINCATRGYGMFALDDRADGTTVGFCGLVHPRGEPLPEAKYALARAHWGRGLASEALVGLLAWSAANGLPTVIATVAEPNAASRRVVEKAGMRFVELQEHDDDGAPTCVYAWGAHLGGDG